MGPVTPIDKPAFQARATTPLALRFALVYVLQNARKHGSQHKTIDEFSSGAWFDGWQRPVEFQRRSRPGVEARTWLLQKGWRKWGLIRFDESPRKGLE